MCHGCCVLTFADTTEADVLRASFTRKPGWKLQLHFLVQYRALAAGIHGPGKHRQHLLHEQRTTDTPQHQGAQRLRHVKGLVASVNNVTCLPNIDVALELYAYIIAC